MVSGMLFLGLLWNTLQTTRKRRKSNTLPTDRLLLTGLRDVILFQIVFYLWVGGWRRG
jgi:hypothetical protein